MYFVVNAVTNYFIYILQLLYDRLADNEPDKIALLLTINLEDHVYICSRVSLGHVENGTAIG